MNEGMIFPEAAINTTCSSDINEAVLLRAARQDEGALQCHVEGSDVHATVDGDVPIDPQRDRGRGRKSAEAAPALGEHGRGRRVRHRGRRARPKLVQVVSFKLAVAFALAPSQDVEEGGEDEKEA